MPNEAANRVHLRKQLRRRAGFRAILVLTAVLWAIPAAGQPRVSVEGASDCPTKDQVANGFDDLAIVQPNGTSWRIEVERDGHNALLRVWSPQGEQVAVRSIDSHDCSALAGAFVAIAQAAMIRLGVLPSHGITPVASAPKPVPEQAPIPVPTTTRPVPPDPRHSWALSPLVEGGLSLGWPNGPTAAAGQLRVDVGLDRSPWRTGIAIGGTVPAAHQDPPDRVRRSQVWSVVNLGMRWGDGFWIHPAVFAGLQVSRVRALDIDGETRRLTRGTTGASVLVGHRLGKSWSLVADFTQTIVLVRDRYVIEPDGVVGQGPRGYTRVMLGAQVDVPL